MRKTARPVVWEPWRVQPRQGDPIGMLARWAISKTVNDSGL